MESGHRVLTEGEQMPPRRWSAGLRLVASAAAVVVLVLVWLYGDGSGGSVAHAAAPAATSEVDQAPPAGSAVPSGTHVTYTVTVTLSAGQAQALTIQLRGDSNIINRTLTCTSSSNGNADQTGPAGAPSCMWLGPIVAGTFTFVFGGDMNASIADAVPAAVSVVCTDTNSTNTCNDELLSDQVPLTDLTGDVGPVSRLVRPRRPRPK
jgi:hypothetical protein